MANTQKAPTSVGAISSFAHLAGALAAKADNDKDEKDDEEDRKKDEKEDKEAKKKAEEEEASVKAEEKEKEEKDKEAARKKAKAEKEKDTSNDDKDYDDGKVERARHAERARIHAIMTCVGAKHAVYEAERLAFNSDMSAEQAIGHLNVKAIEMLSAAALKPAPKTDALRDRMAGEPQPDIGAGMEGGGTGDAYQDQVRTTAAAIIAAGKKRRGGN